MEHTHTEITCPNCGSTAKGNFCYQCGQETHLHKETFWGLVMHFIGHYFHYDSKFWQSLKALWFSPGKLTIAYMNKQRMRYIPPISLYIFISAVFFLVKLTSHDSFTNAAHNADSTQRIGSVATITARERSHNALDNVADKINRDTTQESDVFDYLDKKADIIKAKHGDPNKYFLEQIKHNFPKIFFFMIPVMAMFLKLLFARRKSMYFVDHAIFAIHYHCLWFSLFLLKSFSINETFDAIYALILVIIAFVYMLKAMRNVYNIGYLRSVVNTITIAFGYIIFFIIFLVLDFFIIAATA